MTVRKMYRPSIPPHDIPWYFTSVRSYDTVTFNPEVFFSDTVLPRIPIRHGDRLLFSGKVSQTKQYHIKPFYELFSVPKYIII